MTTHSVPLTTIKHTLSMVDDWFDSNRPAVGPLDRLALEETWNAYYSVAEACKAPSTTSQLFAPPLSALYLETVRLQQNVLDIGHHYSLSTQLTQAITTLLTELKQSIAHYETPSQVDQLMETAEQIVAGHTTTVQMTNHSIPSSPTPRPQKAPSSTTTDTMISSEQLERLLSGYAANGWTKEKLAHELMMDPDFQLQKSKPATELEQRIDSIARQAFFDRIDEDLRHHHDLTLSVLPLLDDIKTRLLSFIPATSTMHHTITDVMDLALFDQQMKQETFDLDKVVQFCLDMMLQMAAPVRDDTIRHIGTATTTHGHQLRLILETLEVMALDLMNFRLKALRPHLVPVAVDYEHDGFAKAVAQGTVGLAKTRQWLHHSWERLGDKNLEATATRTVVDEGYMGLLTATTAWTRLTCPETVLLDIDRIVAYQNDLQEVTIVAALAMLGRNAGISDIKSFTKRIFVLLKDIKDNKAGVTLEHLALEMERAISAPVTEEKKNWIRSMVGKTLAHEDPLYRLLAQRAASAIRHQLTTGAFLDDAALLQSGLEPVRPQLQSLCTRAKLFAEHNYRVYASWYQEMVKDFQT